ncbi:MAG: SIS domain-containing protein [Actinobacteria bacterium]|nr:SIS domain-containing protein [Actinomycetota bacterium]
MVVDADGLELLARAAFARREDPARALGAAAGDVARACEAMAERFRRGGKLLAFGNGGPSTDAQHVSVEFVHPVIVGKRALPALSLVTDTATVMGVARRAGLDEVFAHQLDVLGDGDDIALGISSDGRCENVLRALAAAKRRGLLTVALLGGDGGPIAASDAVDHVLVVPSDDPQIVKEVHVTAYHVLWELVHVFLDRPDGVATDAGDLGGLYPFLYGGTGDADLRSDVARSTAEKVDEIVRLRGVVGDAMATGLAACARDLRARFAGGGKLLTFGNGGSSSDAQEVAQSFLEPGRTDMPPLPALCLTNDIAVLTALSNDVDFDVVFARQLRAFGKPDDAVIGLSTSGNSPNLIGAFDAARRLGLLTIGFAGSDGGAMAAADTVDHLFVVPSSSVHRIQEVQTTLYHVLRELTAAATAA